MAARNSGTGEDGPMVSYSAFIAQKRALVPNSGIVVSGEELHPSLFPFQRDLTRWALAKGRAALFTTTGTGKTRMQLEWARLTGERALILTPLAVAQQTVREGRLLDLDINYARRPADSPLDGITVINYEMLDHFDPADYGAVVLDESGILKNFAGATRTALIEAFRDTPMRLCCTATPAPNDIAEIANHAEFLGVMTRAEMLAAFFVHDDRGWRLKGHARKPFYRWLASWGMSLTHPRDLGYEEQGYDLPPLTIEPRIVPTDYTPVGRLFADRLQGITERASVRRDTVDERVEAAVGLIQCEPHEPWIAWCGLNDEARTLAKWIPDSVNVEGSQSAEVKTARIEAFLSGEKRVLISKPTVAGYGLNLQHCARMVFVGLGDSYEQYFQCLRRCWRFGQTREVRAYVVLSEPEEVIYRNVLAKEREVEKMSRELVKNAAEFERAELQSGVARDGYRAEREMVLPRWL